MRTKIGVVICGLENHRQFVGDAYIQAVKSVGGLPIVLPLIKSKTVIQEYIELCDGFLFCGGGDITPLLFGQEPATNVGKTDITLDINLVDFDTINHMQNSISRRDISHKVIFEPESKVHKILGSFAYTNSFHHQSIDRLGKGLAVSGFTGDAIVEAIEMPSHTFVLGVQWHPESMLDCSNMKQLFYALIRYSKTI